LQIRGTTESYDRCVMLDRYVSSSGGNLFERRLSENGASAAVMEHGITEDIDAVRSRNSISLPASPRLRSGRFRVGNRRCFRRSFHTYVWRGKFESIGKSG
jgi:hypothetical protein